MLETLGSLIGPFFNGIWGLVSGRFGWQAPLAALLSVVASWFVFSQSNAPLPVPATVIAVLVLSLVNFSVAFWTFLIVNGNAFSASGKVQGWVTMWVTAVILAIVWGTVGAGIGLALLDIFVDVNVWTTAVINALAVGTLVATATIAALKSYVQK